MGNMAADVLSDAPEAADQYEFSVEDGDVIMLATDGVFDNIPDSILVEEIGILQNGPLDAAKIQAVANSIALIARKLSQDDTFLSPFAKNARAHGFWNVIGGKEDDVTVILASDFCFVVICSIQLSFYSRDFFWSPKNLYEYFFLL